MCKWFIWFERKIKLLSLRWSRNNDNELVEMIHHLKLLFFFFLPLFRMKFAQLQSVLIRVHKSCKKFDFSFGQLQLKLQFSTIRGCSVLERNKKTKKKKKSAISISQI